MTEARLLSGAGVGSEPIGDLLVADPVLGAGIGFLAVLPQARARVAGASAVTAASSGRSAA